MWITLIYAKFHFTDNYSTNAELKFFAVGFSVPTFTAAVATGF